MRRLSIVLVLFTAFLAPLPVAQAGGGDKLPPGFRQVVPRGRIAAIDSPRFVGAREARIPPDAWVLGIVIDGEARAYSLNLLNRHEIVNDRVGQRGFAAVW
jgi:hypothetical protein